MDVEWTEPALQDLKAIRDYIARDSSYYAEKVVDEAFMSSVPQYPYVKGPMIKYNQTVTAR